MFDIFKTIGVRYQVYEMTYRDSIHNVPDHIVTKGKSFQTRPEAEVFMRELEADLYDMVPSLEDTKIPDESATVDNPPSKGLSSDSPGLDSKGDTKKVS